MPNYHYSQLWSCYTQENISKYFITVLTNLKILKSIDHYQSLNASKYRRNATLPPLGFWILKTELTSTLKYKLLNYQRDKCTTYES